MDIGVDATALGSGRGGDETYLRAVLRGLAAVGDDRIVAYARHGASVDAETDGRLRWNTISPAGSARLAGPLALAWRRGGHDAQLAYTHVPFGAPKSTALVVTDLSFRHVPDMYPRSARARLEALVPFQARRAPAVITLTDFCRDDLIENCRLEPEKVFVAPCAIDDPIELESDEADAARSSLRARGVDGPFVLYLGNLHARKNVAGLIRAFARSETGTKSLAKLVIAGAEWFGGGGEHDAMAGVAQEQVVRLGRVSDIEREVLLRDATCLGYPSFFEGFGLPPLEAMARGTAVVASNRTSIPEVVGDAGLLVDPADDQAIADALDELVLDERRRAHFEAAGLERAARYDVDQTGRGVRAALKRAVESSK